MSGDLKTDERLAQLEAYLRQDPDNPLLLSEAVGVAIEGGALDRAQALLAASAAGDDLRVQHARGLLLLAQHHFDNAAQVFESVLRQGGDNASVRFNHGYALFRQGANSSAARVFESLVDNPGAPPGCLAYLLRSLHHAGELDKARKAWQTSPPRLRTVEACAVASLVYLDSGQSADARDLADDVLRRDESLPPLEALVVRATLAIGDGEQELGSRLLSSAIERAPGDGRIWSAVAAAWLLRGDVVAGGDALRRAAALLPTHIGTWISLSWCQIALRDLEGARSSLAIAQDLDRNFAEVHGGLAVVAALGGRREEARRSIERALTLDRTSLGACYAEAILQGQGTDPVAAVDLATRLLRGRPGIDGSGLLERVFANRTASAAIQRE